MVVRVRFPLRVRKSPVNRLIDRRFFFCREDGCISGADLLTVHISFRSCMPVPAYENPRICCGDFSVISSFDPAGLSINLVQQTCQPVAAAQELQLDYGRVLVYVVVGDLRAKVMYSLSSLFYRQNTTNPKTVI